MNKRGRTLSPTSEAFQPAPSNADWKSQPGYGVILANQPGEKSWPMTAATSILIYKKPSDPASTSEALKFFAWAYKNGSQMAESLDYVPMPAKVVSDVERYWRSEIKDADTKRLFAMTNSSNERAERARQRRPFLVHRRQEPACVAACGPLEWPSP